MAVYQTDWASKWDLYSPDKIAFKEFETGRSLTYARLNRLANRLAWRLTGHYGLQKGDRLAALAENCLEYILLFSAAQKTGIILVPLNYRLSAGEIDYLIDHAAPRLVVGSEKYQSLLDATQAYGRVPAHWSMEEIQALGEEEGEDPPFPAMAPDDDDPVFILYTSGTTGFPKGALYTHKMLFWNSVNTAMSLIVNTESRTVNVMPPFHTGGWNVLTTPFFHHGGYTCLMRKFEPEAVFQALQTEKVTIFMGVPTMLNMLANQPGFDAADFSSLYYIIVGGEPMPIPLIERWHAKGVFIRQGYGMTEVGPNLTSLHQSDAVHKKGSIGRPNYYVDIRIVDESGRDQPPGQPGELLLRGPMVTPGYWQNPEATRTAIVNGWFHSGDMVIRDEGNYLYVVDRIKNMFISGGENVYPAEIERVLVQHPVVQEVCVTGIPDPKWGEVGRAFVVLKPGALAAETDLLEFCQGKLARFKIPKSVVFLPDLPKNDTGKINRKALEKWQS